MLKRSKCSSTSILYTYKCNKRRTAEGGQYLEHDEFLFSDIIFCTSTISDISKLSYLRWIYLLENTASTINKQYLCNSSTVELEVLFSHFLIDQSNAHNLPTIWEVNNTCCSYNLPKLRKLNNFFLNFSTIYLVRLLASREITELNGTLLGQY